MIRLDTKKPANLSDVSYWEHNYGIDKKRNRWLTLPITGKLKIIDSHEKIGFDGGAPRLPNLPLSEVKMEIIID